MRGLRNGLAGLLERLTWRLRGPAAYRTAWPREPMCRFTETPLRYEKAERADSLVFLLPEVHTGSGGIYDIVRIGEGLRRDHGMDVYYLLDSGADRDSSILGLQILDAALPASHVLSELGFVPRYLCATAWRTAYAGLAHAAETHLYLVQDYEPHFYSAGLEHYHAERSYQQGRHVVTVGPWLASWLNARFDLAPSAVALPFPVVREPKVEEGGRNSIVFSVQPEKKHRGNELLWDAARLLHTRPEFKEVEFVFFGSKGNLFKTPDFPCRQEGSLIGEELDALLQRARVGVAASFSNISLTPFHMLSRGAWVVELDLPNVRENVPSLALSRMTLVSPQSEAIADAVHRAWDASVDTAEARRVAEGLHETNGWPAVIQQFYSLLPR